MRRWLDKDIRHVWSLLIVVCLIVCAPTRSISEPRVNANTTPFAPCQLELGPRVNVVGIENSDTVKLADGRVVRLLGLLGPRAPDFNTRASTWPAEAEAQEALRVLVGGREVRLAFDQRRRDRYGQLLAHIFVWHNGSRLWVQGELLAHGHARAAVLPGNTACIKELLSHEHLAHAPARGIWHKNFYRILKPEPAAWLLSKRRHRFVVIEGRISNVAVRNSKIYLNFGQDWRHDLTAALRKRSLHRSETTLADLIALKGKRVRVRGWIERRNGPYIKLAHPSLVEQIDDGRSSHPNESERLEPRMARGDEAELAHWQRKLRLKIPRLIRRKKNRPQTLPSANDL